MGSCNGGTVPCEDLGKISNSIEQRDSRSMINASLQRVAGGDPPISNTVELDVRESQCNLDANCSDTNKQKGRRWIRRKLADLMQKGRLDIQGDASLVKEDFVKPNSHDKSVVVTNGKTDLEVAPLPELSKSQKKKMRRKRKRSASVIDDKARVPATDLDSKKMDGSALNSEKQSDNPKRPKLRRSQRIKMKMELERNASVTDDKAHVLVTDLDLTKRDENASKSEKQSDNPRSSKLSRSQRLRMKRKLKRNASVIDDKAHVPVTDLGSKKMDENALKSEKQGDNPRSPELSKSEGKKIETKPKFAASLTEDKARVHLAGLDLIKIDGNALKSEQQSGCPGDPELSKLEKKGRKKKQKLNASLVDDNRVVDLDLIKIDGNALNSEKQRDSPVPELTKSERKRLKKEHKLTASTFDDKAHVPLAELDFIKIGENALNSEKQRDSLGPVLSKSERKRLKKEQKLTASVVDDKEHIPHTVLDLIKINENALNSEKQRDSPGPVLSKSEKKRLKKEQKLSAPVVDDKAHVPLAELDFIKIDENALNSEKQSYPVVPELSKSERKRLKKERKINASVVDDKEHVPYAVLDLIKINETALNSEKQSDSPGPVLSKSEKKRLKKEQKLSASVIDNKAHFPLAELDFIKIDENALNSEKQSDSAVSELSKSERKRTKKKRKLNSSMADDKAHVPFGELNLIKMEENILKLEQPSDSPGSPSTSLVKEHDNNGEGDLVVQKENFKSYHMNVNSNNHQRRKRQSSDSEEKVEPVTGSIQTSPDSNEVPSLKIPENEVESLQSGACATSIKVAEDVDFDYQIEDNLPQASHSSIAGLRVVYPDKKLLILDVNGLLADILPYGETSKKAHITIARKSVFKRPFCDDFLQFCFEKFNVGVWSSRTKYRLLLRKMWTL
ncbi:uncharacterized protein LOC126671123 isoform X2 [Mercurialis annua]|uniref:uncharacterized protein LOC126671123 isoform X2 n=1 Tax=Mercurialis annua TaxID=3986 RepID=UPI00215F5B9C|nr:uncharacterized protein LOC126671123 isoform X2 [Mercurialis annua]